MKEKEAAERINVPVNISIIIDASAKIIDI
jgi:hypothetical protein